MTAQINRSQIFKNAWNFVRTLALSISEALKKAWAEAKNGIGAMAVIAEEVKDDKPLIAQSGDTHCIVPVKIINRGKKAVLVEVAVYSCDRKFMEYGYSKTTEEIWLPLSQISILSDDSIEMPLWLRDAKGEEIRKESHTQHRSRSLKVTKFISK